MNGKYMICKIFPNFSNKVNSEKIRVTEYQNKQSNYKKIKRDFELFKLIGGISSKIKQWIYIALKLHYPQAEH